MKKTVIGLAVAGLAAGSLAMTTSASAATSNPTKCYKNFGYFHVLHSGDGLAVKTLDGEKITIPVAQGKWKIVKAKNIDSMSNCAAASHLFTQWLANEKIPSKSWRAAPLADKDGFIVQGKKNKNQKIKFVYAGE